jgi:hypothetical protein
LLAALFAGMRDVDRGVRRELSVYCDLLAATTCSATRFEPRIPPKNRKFLQQAGIVWIGSASNGVFETRVAEAVAVDRKAA